MSAALSPAWSSRLALASSALLALIVVWLVVRIVWLVIGGVSVESAPALPVPQSTVAGNGPASGEFRWNLFGRSAAPSPAPRPAPISDGPLRLRGVMAGDRGYAIIAADGDGEGVYRVDDELPGGGRVKTIEARQVVIERNGRRETLALDPDAVALGRDSGGGRNDASRPDEPERELPDVRGFNAPTGASVASLPDAARSMGLDPGELAGSISAMPVEGGGFRVRPGRNARLFGELGLQVNDVVVAVNGQPLESARAVQRLFAEVMSEGQVAIRVRRDGRELTLRPDLEKIMESLQSR